MISLLLIFLLQLSLLFPNVISTCSTTSNVEFTFYGYPDGPSDTTSFGCSGTQQVADGTAGGTGTYANPETFATALTNPNFTPCEIIYIPLFKKYFQYMDHCEKCMELYASGTTRIDLWIGTDVNGGQKQIACEDAFGLKTGETIVTDPPGDLEVNGGMLWDEGSGTCGDVDQVFPSYEADGKGLCGGSSSSSSGSSPPVAAAAAAAPAPTSTSSSSSIIAPSSPPPSTSTVSSSSNANAKNKEVDTVNKVAQNLKADAAVPPAPTTLSTIVSSSSSSPSTSSSTIPAPTSPSPSSSSSSSNNTTTTTTTTTNPQDCGVTAEWPTPWLGHCVGTPCTMFNDCSGELICQGWPDSVCTSPR